MKTRPVVFTLTLLAALAVTSALASGGGYVLEWFTVDGGGGMSSGGGIVVEGAIGQPDAGEMSGGGITVVGGFYSEEDSVSAPAGPLYLPVVMRNFVNYFPGPCEVEPNNASTQANGPLISGQAYCGYYNPDPSNVDRDFFTIVPLTAGNIIIDLTNVLDNQPVQLSLYYQSTNNQVAFVSGPEYFTAYQIVCPSVAQPDCSGASGLYYIRVYLPDGYSTNTPYTLQVTYP